MLLAGAGSAAAQTPAQPAQPTATAGVDEDGNVIVTVSWTAPDNGGSAITGYDIQTLAGDCPFDSPYPSGCTSPTDHTAGASDTSADIESLTNGTWYSFRLRASNANGDGPWSWAGWIFLPDPDDPQPPFQVTGFRTSPGNASVALDWDAPQGGGGGTAASYDVQWKLATGGWNSTNEANTTATAYTVSSLTNGSKYYFRVRGRNDEGPGAWSLVKPGTPGVPILTLSPGWNQLTASWSAVSANSYKLRYRYTHPDDTGNGPYYPWTTLEGVSSPTTITSLSAVDYDVQVEAIFAAETQESNIARATPNWPPTLGILPNSLEAQGQNAQVLLSWQVDDAEGSSSSAFSRTSGPRATTLQSMSFEAGCTQTGSSWSEGQTATSETTSVTVTQLSNGVAHSCRVRSVSGSETGDWSAAVSATPEAPGPTLVKAFGDMSLANAASRALDMTEHFSGTGLSYEIMVTTTHKRTGRVKTGRLGTVARNKISGVWSGGTLTLTAGAAGDHVLGMGVTATDGDGNEASGSFTLTVGPIEETPTPGQPAAPTIASGDAELSVAWTAPSESASGITYDLDIGIGADWTAGPAMMTGLATTSATVADLVNGTTYDFRVRAVEGSTPGPWSATARGTPAAQAALVTPFDDLTLANGAVQALDMSEHFSGTALSYVVMVTTTHKRTGRVKTGRLGTVARNKISGTWAGTVLTLTAGPAGDHVLGMEIEATDPAGGTASDDFTLTVSTTVDTEGALAQAATQQVLVHQARGLLETATRAIGERMGSGQPGSDALTSLASLLGGTPGFDECALGASITDCVHHRRVSDREVDAGLDGAWLRERIRGQGIAVSLNPTEHEGMDPSSMHLTLWGNGSDAVHSGSGTLFWGMDAKTESWITGVAFARTNETGTWALPSGQATVSGLVESEVTAIYPYVKGRLTDALEVWSLAGWGNGHLEGTWTDAAAPERPMHLHGGLRSRLAAVGAEHTLLDRGGWRVSVLGDAGYSTLELSGPDATTASVHRTRLGIEGGYASRDGALTSALRMSGRMDGGDGDRAQGTEIAGSVRHVTGRMETGLEGRWYDAGKDLSGLTEQGLRASLGLRPQADGTGLAFSLSPGWGSGTDARRDGGLLEAFHHDVSAASVSDGLRLDGRIAWGTRLSGQRLLRPYVEMALAEDASRHARVGFRLEGAVNLNLALDHQESEAGTTDTGMFLRLDTRF